MRLENSFTVSRSRDDVVEALGDEATLLELIPGDTEIVERDGDRCTTRTRYAKLGVEGVATFHWTFLMDGNVRFEKVCDGNVWRQLSGELSFEELGADHTRVRIELEGRTRPLVPEFTIRGPMQEQISQMAAALKRLIEA